jgi:predicted unusual protein kinase regulating ubiquinone biosynthesis (AarF/ABC1/UbiB family)
VTPAPPRTDPGASGRVPAFERVRRAARIARAAGVIWALYKLPDLSRRLLRRPPPAERDRTHERAAREALATALSLRGVVIKVCQVIATRADVFPPPFIEILKQCHDAVPPRDFATVRAVIELELGKPLDAVYAAFDPTPLASASLAQVHRARLHDGRDVAVKVQYPEIQSLVSSDLANIRRACRVYEFFDPQPLELLPLLDELNKYLALELDFEREADNADRIRAMFADDPGVRVPEIHRDWSSRRVVTMELMDGMKVTDRDALARASVDRAELVQSLTSIYVRMILAQGFFQADPHPGNLFVQPDGGIVLLDFGLAKELPEGFGLGLFELMFSMMTLNEAAMIRAFQELGFETKTGDPSTFVEIARRMMRRSDTGRFEGEFTEEMTDELFEAIRENPVVRVPSDFVLVGRVFSLLSGIAHTLGHRANVLEALGASTSGA